MAHSADGPRAHDLLLSYEPLSAHGACWYYVWKALAATGAQNDLGGTRTAYRAWQQSQGKHTDRNPREGALIFLGKRTRDGNMDGDVFIAGAYDGDHAATDQPTWGKTGRTTIAERMRLTGREYLGWTDHAGNAPIKLGSVPSPSGNISKTQRKTAALVNRRNDPSTKHAALKNPLTKGTVGNFVGWKHGEKVSGNDVWFKGISGDWFWSGGFTSKSTSGLKDLNAPAPKPKPSNTPKPSDVLGWEWTGIQRMLKADFDYTGKIDNKPGAGTKKAFRRFTSYKGYSTRANGWPLAITATFNVNDVKAAEVWLRDNWDYDGKIDGIPGPKMHAAWNRAEKANGAAYAWVK